MKSHYISLFRTLRVVPFEFTLPIFGSVSTLDEILNIHDNFGRGELRHDGIECHIKSTSRPIIIDCGINIGITARWWHSLNHAAVVYGFDMMEEAHAFTKSKIESPMDWYVPITCVLAADEDRSVNISFDSPLFGENSVSATNRKQSRVVKTGTLDATLRGFGVGDVDVLKMDIEGYGAEAFKGARHMLSKTKFVIFETHSKEEISGASDILYEAGFKIIAVRNRTLIYERS
jgi:FkbM family methyltransferase